MCFLCFRRCTVIPVTQTLTQTTQQMNELTLMGHKMKLRQPLISYEVTGKKKKIMALKTEQRHHIKNIKLLC